MKRKGLGLDEVSPADVVTIDLDGRKVAGRGEVHLEAPLHTEVYKVRPDVGAVIHTHPPYATAFAAVDVPLLYLSHDALLFADGIAMYEDSHLVVTPEAGAAIARALGHRRAIILRNHGVVVVGPDVRWAVLTAVTLERAIRVQVLASALGPARPIPAGDVPTLQASKYREEFLDEYWAYWLRVLRRRGLDVGMPDSDTPPRGSER
jgi:L-fuculose-phosphate aldolase